MSSTPTNSCPLVAPVPVLQTPASVPMDAVTSEPTPELVTLESHAGAGFFCREINARSGDRKLPPRILIAGCGAGHEAVAIQRELNGVVDAVDIEDFVSPDLKLNSPVRFGVASVCQLPFQDSAFDAIFYHHVIEHVDDPVGSLAELNRVLAPGGWLFVGTPNRHRLVSSIGAHQQSTWDATFANKLADNIRDWNDRLTGRFRNELGAHAGFSRKELDRMLAEHFNERYWLTKEYLKFKYASGRAAKLLPIATNSAVCWFTAPAIYALCRKSP
ncbi:MAG: class I SAM-dependent methyltransferase [Pirellula sp.]|jgi:SAM-dependent methyltransferase